MCPLYGLEQHARRSFLEKVLHQLYAHGIRSYSFQGLATFKKKFHPTWQPKYLVYRRQAHLPLIGKALVRVHYNG
jgi:phosphatidylglycerol lysyltransferase